jgi:hypothetical protein
MYTAAWILWITLFLGVEGIALKDKDAGDTFTEHFRKWLKLSTPIVQTTRTRVTMWSTRSIVVLFGAWLTAHMAFGWFGGGEGFLG